MDGKISVCLLMLIRCRQVVTDRALMGQCFRKYSRLTLQHGGKNHGVFLLADLHDKVKKERDAG